jgi:hypothetical protein
MSGARVEEYVAIGAPGRNRTCDPSIRNRVLYPLSYGGGGTG